MSEEPVPTLLERFVYLADWYAHRHPGHTSGTWEKCQQPVCRRNKAVLDASKAGEKV